MKLTTITQITLDGVTQGNGGSTEEDLRNGFDRGGWARGAGDDSTRDHIAATFQRADAFLFGRRTYDVLFDFWGTIEDLKWDPGPDVAVDETVMGFAFPREEREALVLTEPGVPAALGVGHALQLGARGSRRAGPGRGAHPRRRRVAHGRAGEGLPRLRGDRRRCPSTRLGAGTLVRRPGRRAAEVPGGTAGLRRILADDSHPFGPR